jgi:hypothetical protein
VTPPLDRALRALLGLAEGAPLPLDYAVLLTAEGPQAALQRAWDAAREPAFLRMALYELRDEIDTTELDERVQDEWNAALWDWRANVAPLPALLAFIADSIRAAVPCPSLAAWLAARERAS